MVYVPSELRIELDAAIEKVFRCNDLGELEPDFEYPTSWKREISRELTFCERSAKSAAARCEQAIQSGANGVVEIVHVAVEYTLRDEVVGRVLHAAMGIMQVTHLRRTISLRVE
ncbi:unnamed protein product [Microthlaspi erraticum]|uniref:Uncharacterized protein n=1 Tax=Microthlaspi erraticum TaxID=1685480 RepID=A0A6D2HTI0_9BRAS|nr:unnamed protein product [Microthlaspi erraticum]